MNNSKRRFLQLLGTSSLLTACSSDEQTTDGSATNPADTDNSENLGEWTMQGTDVPELISFDNTLQSFMQARNIPGGSLAVTRGGKLTLARGYTFKNVGSNPTVKPNSLFRIASISKPITATAVMRLAQENRLDLSSRIRDILSLTPPSGQSIDPRLPDITILNLLQHLGGWDRDSTFDPMFRDFVIATDLGVPLPVSKYDIATYMSGQALQHTPGTRFAYSNYGYSLLGQIIEEVSGLSYQDYVKQEVFTPLQITRPQLGRTQREFRLSDEVSYHSPFKKPTVFDDSATLVSSPYGAWNLENMDAHGGWLASAVDLVRFASAFDEPTSSPILNRNSIEAMFALPENISAANYASGDAYYSNGWLVRDWGNGIRNTWHDGSLPGTFTLLVRRRDGLNWAVLFNQRADSSGLSYGDIDGLLHDAADSVSGWPDHDLFEIYL